MKALAFLGLLAGGSLAAQAPCAKATDKARTTFYLEPAAARPADTARVVRLCVASPKPVGSYMATLTFDSTRIRVLSVATRGGMQASNAKIPGMVKLAGAAPAGFENGVLATVTLRPATTNLESIALSIPEANAVSGGVISSIVAVGVGSPKPVDGKPVIDSIIPRSGPIENERVTDLTIYGRGFGARGNTVRFGDRDITGLVSERSGSIIRFPAPGIRVREGRIPVRVILDGAESNAVTFIVKDDK